MICFTVDHRIKSTPVEAGNNGYYSVLSSSLSISDLQVGCSHTPIEGSDKGSRSGPGSGPGPVTPQAAPPFRLHPPAKGCRWPDNYVFPFCYVLPTWETSFLPSVLRYPLTRAFPDIGTHQRSTLKLEISKDMALNSTAFAVIAGVSNCNCNCNCNYREGCHEPSSSDHSTWPSLNKEIIIQRWQPFEQHPCMSHPSTSS